MPNPSVPTKSAGDKLFAAEVNDIVLSYNGKAESAVTVNGHALTANVTVTKSDVGLSAVPNIDATNPANIVQTATFRFATDAEKALWNAGAPLSSPSFTGTPTAPTAPSGQSNTQLATTAFVQQEITASAIYFDNTMFGGTGSSGNPITIIGGGGGGGVFDGAEVIARGTISNATQVDINLATSALSYRRFELQFYALKFNTNSVALNVRVSNDGTTFLTTANYGYVRDLALAGQTQSGVTFSFATADHIEIYNTIDNGTGKFVKFEMVIEDPNNAAIFPEISGTCTGWEASVGRKLNQFMGWYETGTGSTLKGIRLYPSAGTIVSGGYRIIGYKN